MLNIVYELSVDFGFIENHHHFFPTSQIFRLCAKVRNICNGSMYNKLFDKITIG